MEKILTMTLIGFLVAEIFRNDVDMLTAVVAAEVVRSVRQSGVERSLQQLKLAKEKPQNELTPTNAALLRLDADNEFWKEFEQFSAE